MSLNKNNKLREPKAADYTAVAKFVISKYPNLEDKIDIARKTSGKTLSDQKATSVSKMINKAMRNRKFRAPAIRSTHEPKERLQNFAILGKIERNQLIKSTLAERNAQRSNDLASFLEQWPFLKLNEGLVGEFKAIRGIKNIDYIMCRIKYHLSNRKIYFK